MFVRWAPRVRFASPKGWPKRARAVGEIKIGREVDVERSVVDVLQMDTGRSTRALKKRRVKLRWFW